MLEGDVDDVTEGAYNVGAGDRQGVTINVI